MRLRLPLATLLLCGAAGAVFGVPQLQALLIYSRAAIAEGEIWRLITGNLVHLSPSHFFCDIAALLLVGTAVEIQGSRPYAMLCLVSAMAVGATVYVGSPELSVFGGLSGVVMAAATFLCLSGLEKPGARRRLCWLGIAALAVKMTIEMSLGASLAAFAEGETPSFVPVPSSHVAGAASAFVLFASMRLGGFRSPRVRTSPRSD